jgi:hypothetical protein
MPSVDDITAAFTAKPGLAVYSEGHAISSALPARSAVPH